MDGRTDRRMDKVEPVYPLQLHWSWGHNEPHFQMCQMHGNRLIVSCTLGHKLLRKTPSSMWQWWMKEEAHPGTEPCFLMRCLIFLRQGCHNSTCSETRLRPHPTCCVMGLLCQTSLVPVAIHANGRLFKWPGQGIEPPAQEITRDLKREKLSCSEEWPSWKTQWQPIAG